VIVVDDYSSVILIWWIEGESCWIMTCELWSEGVSFGDDYLMMFGDKYDYVLMFDYDDLLCMNCNYLMMEMRC